MVNTSTPAPTRELSPVARLVGVYVLVALATVVALAILSSAGSDQATDDAWVHAVIVGIFAILLPVRLRSATHGSDRALMAVGIIAAVLVAVNVIEAVIPDLFPAWMRIEMVGIAVLMIAIAVLVVRARR